MKKYILFLFLLLFVCKLNCINIKFDGNDSHNHYKIKINNDNSFNYNSNNKNNSFNNSLNNGYELKIIQNKNIGCEIHSWNDLNEFDQMYKKGVVWNKIDVHYMPNGEFCLSQGLNDSRGCFVFSHDTPSPLFQYNTTLDLLNYIQDRKDVWYSTKSVSNTLKFMDFCFKAHFSICGDSKEAKDYLELLDEFILNLLDVKDRLSLNIEFVLDGKGIQIDCLKDKWDPLISTWIDQPFGALFSNDPEKGYDKFQVADIYIPPIFPSFWIEVLCLFRPPFGKFHNSSYPILVWEPASQHDIESVCLSYHSCLARNSDMQFPELRFASNIDPIQLSLYAGSVSNKTWNFKIDESGLVLHSSNSPPSLLSFSSSININSYQSLISTLNNNRNNSILNSFDENYFSKLNNDKNNNSTTINSSSSNINLQNLINPKIISYQLNNINHFIVFFTNDTSTTSIYYHLFNSNQILGRLNYLNTFKLNIPSNSTFKSPVNTIKLLDNNTTLFIIDDRSNYLILNLESTDIAFKILDFNSLKNNSGNASSNQFINTFDIIINNNISGSSGFVIVEYFSTNISLLSVNIWKFDKITVPINDIPNYESKTLLSTFNNSSNSSDGNYTTIITSLSSLHKFSENEIIESIILFSNDKKEIYGNYLKINQSNMNQEFSIISGPNKIDVGEQVSSTMIDNELVMQVHSEGYCFNSERHNKRPGPRVCESSAVSTPKILNYNFGYFDDYVLQIQSNEMITSCNAKILHGTYNQGSFPSIHLYKEVNGTVNDFGLKYGVVEVHQGLPLDFIDNSNCGRPTSWNQIVLDSWKLLPDYLKLK